MLAQRLKQLRLDNEVNQIQMADEIGVSQSTIGRWETGKRAPDFEMLRKLANYFSVTVDYLLGDEREQTPELLLLARKVPGISEIEKNKLIDELNNTIDTYLKSKDIK